MLLSVKNLTKEFQGNTLFKNISFTIAKGQKIGLLGTNGSGKSTLLKLLLGIEHPSQNKLMDNTEIKYKGNLKIAYIKQDSVYAKNKTIHEIVKENVDSNVENYEIDSILNKLGFTNYDLLADTLSGGERKKVSLAIALLDKSDLLILDEPTNHLDSNAIDWLESYLNSYSGGVLLVTHDRYFLNKVVNEIYEIDNKDLFQYKDVNFDDYLILKEERLKTLESEARKNKTLFRKEKKWIERGAIARRTKSRERIARFEKLKGAQGNEIVSKLDLTSVSSRLGTKVINIENISKNYKEKKIFNSFSYSVGKFERLGIVGVNGSGKSTLLKILTGEILPDSGKIEIGSTVKVGYFSQDAVLLDSELKIIDFIKNKAEYIQTIHGEVRAETILERFLFKRDIQHKLIKNLSGGEKKRLYLLGIIMDAPNVLILDEPTNDFDINILMLLEEYLENFQGTIIAVSHDRYFLNKVVDKMLVIDENQKIKLFNGNYDDYMDSYNQAQKNNKVQKKEITSKEKIPIKIKLTYGEKKELESIDDEISLLENNLKLIDEEILKNGHDFEKLNPLLQNRKKSEDELNHKTDRWLYLNEKLEQSK